MANVLVNGMKSKVGGGKAILDTYLDLLIASAPADQYFVLTPDRAAYRHLETPQVTIIDVPGWAHSNWATTPLYRIVLPMVLARHRIDAILNFGDLVIPSTIPQLYNFDWAFAVYRDHISWQSLGWKERLLYRVKLHFFEAYLAHATVILAQTDAIKARLEAQYGLLNVEVVPAAVSVAGGALPRRKFNLPADAMKLVYPANYYPHKNIEILEPVAKLAKARGLRVAIVTTLSEEEHPGAKAFLTRCRLQGLDSVLVNVGRLRGDDIPALFEATDALLMPTLLETFGLPYVEAMHHGKPILTSDLDFAHAVCGNVPLYFDPTDAASIVDAIARLIEEEALYSRMVKRGHKRLKDMWAWDRVFGEYQRLIRALLGRSSDSRMMMLPPCPGR